MRYVKMHIMHKNMGEERKIEKNTFKVLFKYVSIAMTLDKSCEMTRYIFEQTCLTRRGEEYASDEIQQDL